MATEIIDNLPEDALVLTSRIDAIRAATDELKVDAQVIRDPDGDAEVFFETTLYAFAGIVELSGVGRLIEEHFRAAGKSCDIVSVVFDGVSLDFSALYCACELSPDFNYRSCFWSSSAVSVVHRGSIVSLSHYDTGSASYRVKVVGLNSDGSIGMVEKDFSRLPQSKDLSFAVDDIIKFGLDQTEIETGGDLVKVSYFAVSHGGMQKVFYIVDEPSFLTFRFRNLFNCPEYVDVVGKVARKTAVERETAVCGGRARHYDQAVNLTYEVETGPLTAGQALALEGLISSYDAQLVASNGDYGIIITDHTCVTDNDDNSLSSMKFSFRFVGNRPVFLGAEMEELSPSKSNIFSKEFSAEFA